MKTRIVLADDHNLFRSGLKQLLDHEPDLEVIGEASNGREALALVEQLRPNLLLIDVVMPELNGIDAVRSAVAHHPGTRALIISGYPHGRYVGDALEAGASGYVTKTAAMSEVLEAIRTVLAGRTWLSPSVADAVVTRYVRNHGYADHDGDHGSHGNGSGNGNGNGNGNGHARGHATAAARTLTAREREVLQLLTEGYASKQIAGHLKVSVKTVHTHRASAMRKLELQSLADLTKYAVREGITTLDY